MARKDSWRVPLKPITLFLRLFFKPSSLHNEAYAMALSKPLAQAHHTTVGDVIIATNHSRSMKADLSWSKISKSGVGCDTWVGRVYNDTSSLSNLFRVIFSVLMSRWILYLSVNPHEWELFCDHVMKQLVSSMLSDEQLIRDVIRYYSYNGCEFSA